jgi:acetyl esterase/lipase
MLPCVRETTSPRPILEYEDAARFLDTYLSGMSMEERKSGRVSPIYNDLQGLGSALFIVGTGDALVDDTLLMSWRWERGGNEAYIKFVPGAPHGFMVFDGRSIEVVKQGWEILVAYLESKL